MTRRTFLHSLAPATQLRAGAAAANISPFLGASLAGYMTDRKCANVHDELYVRCAALESGSTRLLLSTIDSCMVPRTVLDAVRATIASENSIPPAHILFSSTHTHSAPPAMHLFQSKPDPAYLRMLERRIADAARMAFARLQPARLGAAAGAEPTLANNRRSFLRPGTVPADPFGNTRDSVVMNAPPDSPNVLSPAGPTDPAHPVLAAISTSGRPIWIYAAFSLHYAGNNPATDASADYFGAWSRQVESENGGLALLANACSGNVNAVHYSRLYPSKNDYSFINRVGAVLAIETQKVLKSLEFHDTAPLAAVFENVELDTRRPTADETADAIKLLGPNPGDDYKDRPQIYARETVYLSRYPASISVPVQALRIGPAAIATFPGETFVELGLAVKQASPLKLTIPISIANDACGYISTVDAFDQGGYETWRAKSSFVERNAATKLTAALSQALRKLPA